MKLIVGIGNPGKEYEHTRHNIGFDVIDLVAQTVNTNNFKSKFNGLYIEFMYMKEKIILLKPQSYVNLSGSVVKKYMDYYKINIDDILIISDDLDQNVGSYKIKTNSSSGGHNGLKDIEKNLGTKNYKRLKIGISNLKDIDTKDYVLGNFNKEDRQVIDSVLDIAVNVVIDFISMPFNQLLTKYNSKNVL